MSDKPKRRWLQFSLRFLLVVVTLAAVGAGLVWRFWPWWRERMEVGRLRNSVLAAKDSAEAGKAYLSLLPITKLERKRSLASDPDAGIALKAIYELLATRTARGLPQDYACLKPDQQEEFLRALRERTGLTPPDWWANGLLEIYPEHRPSEYQFAEVAKDQKVTISVGQEHLILTAQQFEPFESQSLLGGLIVAHIGHRRSYVADCQSIGSGFDLHCLDSATGSTIWKSLVWSLGKRSVIGRCTHGAQIRVKDDLVIVWGDGTGGSYVETFDAATGQNRLRFCTESWDMGLP